MSYHVPAYPAQLASGWHAAALGGGGLGRALVHLFIWRLIWRGGLAIWRVPTFGPAIAIAAGLGVVALIVVRSQRGPRWWERRGGSSGGASPRSRDDAGPRDW